MCIFKSFETVFDQYDQDGVRIPPPPIADEWLTPEEINQKRPKGLRQGRTLYQDLHVKNKGIKEDLNFEPPLPVPIAPQQMREHVSQTRGASSWKREAPAIPTPGSNSQTPSQSRYPSRSNRGQRDFLQPSFDNKSYDSPPQAKYLSAVTAALCLSTPSFTTPIGIHHFQYQAIGVDPFAGSHEFYHPGILQSPYALTLMENPLSILEAQISAFQATAHATALKAGARDPDLLSLRESLTGPYANEFWAAMDKEIDSIKKMGTWEVIERSSGS